MSKFRFRGDRPFGDRVQRMPCLFGGGGHDGSEDEKLTLARVGTRTYSKMLELILLRRRLQEGGQPVGRYSPGLGVAADPDNHHLHHGFSPGLLMPQPI